MAVFYQTGVATTPLDLLTKLVTFAEAHGWDSGTPASGDVVLWDGTAGGIFAGIDATATQWNTRGCLSFSGGSAFDAQPHNAGITHAVLWGAGPYTAYHFYVGDENGSHYAHVTVEYQSGKFNHWILGRLVKSGAYTGGTYSDSTDVNVNPSLVNSPEDTHHRHLCDANNVFNQSAHLWCDYDSKTNNWQKLRGPSDADVDACIGSSRSNGAYAALVPLIGWQRWNLRTPLFPMLYFANRAGSLRSQIGRVPNMRFVNMTNFSDGEVVTYGGESWQVFSVFAKQSVAVASGVLSSSLYGYAHKR